MLRRISILFILILPFASIARPIPELLATIKGDTNRFVYNNEIVPLGDQNNDGYDDFITWGFKYKASLYYGGAPMDTLPALVFDNVNGRINNVGKLNDDDYFDFTLPGMSPQNWKLGVYYGGPDVDTLRNAWLGIDTEIGIGFTVNGNDINSNGTKELISYSGRRTSVLLYEIGLSPDSIHDMIITPANITGTFKFGRGISSGDFNGDGLTDLAVSLQFPAALQERGSVYLYWGGADFDTIPDLIIRRPGKWFEGAEDFGEVLETLGDFNGDGFNDLIAGSASSRLDSSHFIYFGGPEIDTIPDIEIKQRLTRAKLAGDLNSDTYNDLIVSNQRLFSNLGDVRVYFGGPGCDNLADIVILNGDMPQHQIQFGMGCAGVGDVNGDGIDDFAFSAIEFSVWTIYIFSGSGPSTGIEIEYEPTLPTGYSLSQNYPNPFNPSTTIEFSLPTRSDVALKVFNVSGQEVAVLINKTLSAGSYKVNWDGRDSDGNEVASGVYFYKLETSEFVDSKKMMLVR